MHERELMTDALDTLRILVGDEDVCALEIALGPSVEATRAAEAWQELAATTPFAATHVLWEEARDLLECDQCGDRYRGARLDSCPCCGGDGVIIEAVPPVSIVHWELGGADQVRQPA